MDKKDYCEAEAVQPDEASSTIDRIMSYYKRQEVLLYMHSWQSSARHTMDATAKMNGIAKGGTKFLVVPVLWAGTSKEILDGDDRNIRTRSERHFDDLFDVLDSLFKTSNVKKSIMAHSTGNYLLRIYAENYKECHRPVFEDVFMVAADNRWDLFNEDVNPGMDVAPSVSSLMTIESAPIVKLHHSQLDGGLQIVNIAKNRVHILYDDGDKTLLHRQCWFSSNKFKTKVSAIGRCAGHAMQKLHPQFENRVVFHYMRKNCAMRHSYHCCQKAIQYYDNPQPNGIEKKAWSFLG